ncbi:MAG: alpha/beta fold hydrolase [Elusimicrobia bacterium]|nr:alpha/beta fold hydrolase [Elusimicrobiota bacterium]
MHPIPMILVFPILFILLIIFWGFVTSNLILKIPRAPLDFNPKSFGFEFESFKTLTEDGIEIDGWFIPSKNKSQKTILVLHGWGANRSDAVSSTIFLAQNHNLVYFDFRNHGRSGGNKTSLTCLEIKDFESVVRYLKSQKPDQVKSLGIFGFSMGGAVAISGAAKIPEIQAVIAESPFASYKKSVYRFAKLFYGIPAIIVPITLYFARWRLGFDPEDCSPIYHVHKLSPRPLLIIQGGNDPRMPVSEGQSLYDKAGEPKEIWVVPGADHGGIHENDPKEYQRKILEFYKKWLKN